MTTTLLLALAMGQAATPAPARPPAVPQDGATAAPTLQQRFDAANAALEAGRCDEAVRDFGIIKGTAAYRRNAFTAATVDVREGRCLVRLGRFQEGEAAIRRGLPAIVAKGTEFAGDAREAQLVLGDLAASRLDYDAAAREYRAAAAGPRDWTRIAPLLRLASVTMFDHDGRALAAADEARALALATPGLTKAQIAQVQTIYARVLLNEGRHAEAYAALKDSLAKQGGLDLKVSTSEIATRSDLAIAALKNKDMDGARRYLAFTGAGRAADSPFVRAAAIDPPVCDPAGGLSPDDQGVIEFSIADDGRVTGVQPIYTTAKRAAALAFARAALDWSWRAEDVAKVPPFFRQATRVEVRCVKAPEPPRLTEPLRDAAYAWLDSQSAVAKGWDALSAAAALPLQRAALAKAQAAGDRPGTVRALFALAASPVTDRKESDAWLVGARDTAGEDMPVAVRAYARLMAARGEGDDLRDGARRLLADRAIAADPLAASTMRLLIAARTTRAKPPADAPALLQAVVAEEGLPARHPLRTAALLAQANALAERGDQAAARTAFDRTGLTSEQCALVGVQPVRRSTGAGNYPMAAVMMGFEGWVRTEADIAADGRTIEPRAVIAYPPFVFDEAATGILKGSRYTGSYRPDGAIACSGKQESVVFRL